MSYFSALIKDARCSFHSRIDSTQLLLTILGDLLDETQLWLVIKDARCSFHSKIDSAQLLLTILEDKLDETQLWLVDILKLKDKDELLIFMKHTKENKTTLHLGDVNFQTLTNMSVVTILES